MVISEGMVGSLKWTLAGAHRQQVLKMVLWPSVVVVAINVLENVRQVYPLFGSRLLALGTRRTLDKISARIAPLIYSGLRF